MLSTGCRWVYFSTLRGLCRLKRIPKMAPFKLAAILGPGRPLSAPEHKEHPAVGARDVS